MLLSQRFASGSCRRPSARSTALSTPSPGITAASHDFNSKMKSALPYVFGFVLLFAFLLLLVSFRSIVIAAKAIVLNLLSVAAAYGVLVLVFQHGWGEGLLNFRSNGGIASWLPLFMFVILFGLSMDYHVFILSRIREAYDRGLKTEDAVAHGIKTTAGVVTSAAVVMVGAFAIFATMPILDMKEMGVGLAAAVLIDATIVRAVLLPATMKLLGDWNWYSAEVARVATAPRARRRGCEGGGTGGRSGARTGRLAQSVPLLRNEKRPGRYRGASRSTARRPRGVRSKWTSMRPSASSSEA